MTIEKGRHYKAYFHLFGVVLFRRVHMESFILIRSK